MLLAGVEELSINFFFYQLYGTGFVFLVSSAVSHKMQKWLPSTLFCFVAQVETILAEVDR